jgi:hypothetical protein
MNAKKPKKSKEEISRIRAEAGRRGAAALKASGNFRGGRKKGWTKNPDLLAVPARTLTVRDPDYNVFVRCANAADKPIVSFMHDVAESLKKKNPVLFTPDAQEVRL